jgi:hypothetical protein
MPVSYYTGLARVLRVAEKQRSLNEAVGDIVVQGVVSSKYTVIHGLGHGRVWHCGSGQ